MAREADKSWDFSDSAAEFPNCAAHRASSGLFPDITGLNGSSSDCETSHFKKLVMLQEV